MEYTPRRNYRHKPYGSAARNVSFSSNRKVYIQRPVQKEAKTQPRSPFSQKISINPKVKSSRRGLFLQTADSRNYINSPSRRGHFLQTPQNKIDDNNSRENSILVSSQNKAKSGNSTHDSNTGGRELSSQVSKDRISVKKSKKERILVASQNRTQSKGNDSIHDRLGLPSSSMKVNWQLKESGVCNFSQGTTKKIASNTKRSNSVDWQSSHVFSDSDDELLSERFSKKDRGEEWKSNSDKENDEGILPLFGNFYSKKRTPAKRSSILSAISPTKVVKAYGARTADLKSFGKGSLQERSSYEEVSPEDLMKNDNKSFSSETKFESPHEMGFLNYGNTCYLNAVLQSLLGLQPFVSDISDVVHEVSFPAYSITSSLWRVIVGRQNTDLAEIRKSLRNIKENLEKIDGSFSGFKMQDANEFLTQALDAIKDEINKLMVHRNNDNNASADKRLLHKEDLSNNSHREENLEVSEVEDVGLSIFDTPSSNSTISLELRMKDEGYTSSDECGSSTRNGTSDLEDACIHKGKENLRLLAKFADSAMDACLPHSDETNGDGYFGENPVRKNFEFELMESYRCLQCNHIEGRRQSHYALYVNLPKDGKDSIQEAVESYMGKDYRELKCSKCNHEKTLVTTSFTRLPRILIVQLKRYEYRQDQLECLKVSSKVNVDMNLNLENLCLDNVKAPEVWVPKPLGTLLKRHPFKSLSSGDALSPTNKSNEVTLVETSSKNTALEFSAGGLVTYMNGENEAPEQVHSHNRSCCSREKVILLKDGLQTDKLANAEVTPQKELDSPVTGNGKPGGEALAIKSAEETQKEKEDKELEEVMLRSLEDRGPQGDRVNNAETEEEEIQKAIRLSLQDAGMCYSNDDSKMLEKDKSEISSYTYSSTEQSEGIHSYRLLSLISHFGLTTCTGHYVSDVYNCSLSQWFHYDDEVVAKLEEGVVFAEGRQKNGYIYFYVHRDIYRQLSALPS